MESEKISLFIMSTANAYLLRLLLKLRPVLVTIVYRRPGTDLETFTKLVSNKLDIVKKDKHTRYLSRVLNINLLRHEVHRQTADLLDIMYSNGILSVMWLTIKSPQWSAQNSPIAAEMLLMIVVLLTISINTLQTLDQIWPKYTK